MPTPTQIPFPSPPECHGTTALLCSPQTINPYPALGYCPRGVVVSPRTCTWGVWQGTGHSRGAGRLLGTPVCPYGVPWEGSGGVGAEVSPGGLVLCWGICTGAGAATAGGVTVTGSVPGMGPGHRGSAKGQSRNAAAVPGLDTEAQGSTASGSWVVGAGTGSVLG